MMCAERVALTWSIIAASVVLLPLPVVPVTRTRPRSSAAICLRIGRQAELVDRSDPERDDAQHDADRAALLEDVGAEPAEAGDAVGEVDLLGLPELLDVLRPHDRAGHRLGVRAVEALLVGRHDQRAVDPHHRIAADLQVQVGRAAGDGRLQQVIDMHGGACGPPARLSARAAAPDGAAAPTGLQRLAGIDVRQPAVPVGRLAVDDGEERLLDRLGDRPAPAACRR